MRNLRGGVSSANMLKGNISSTSMIRGSLSIGNISTSVIDPSVIKQIIEAYLKENLIPTSPTASIGVVELLAANWVETETQHLYAQVVSIEGVTENSQVDLTPNVEQLLVFYEKDLTFVTENDGGVVTVYAIGQKPTHDYVIQVTITEVNV